MGNSPVWNNIPTELSLLLLRHCLSIRDVVALSSTCKRIYNIWDSHREGILWPVLCNENIAFDEALIAARLIQLVADAERGGEQPPTDVSPGEWSGHCHLPDLQELESAQVLCNFSRTVQIAIYHMEATGHPRDIQLPCNGGQLPEQPERMAEWQARIDMAVYRSLILGASLAGQYAGEVEEAHRCQVRLADRVDHSNNAHSDAHWVVWNLMQVFWVAGNICLFIRGNYPGNCYTQSDDKGNSVPLVLFHGFQIENFQISKILNWDKKPSIAMFGPKRQKLENWERFYCPRGDCANTLHSLDVDNEYELEDHDGDVFDLSPLSMKFVEFFLQQYLKLGIIPGAFQRESSSGPYEQFFRNITIFSHDDVEGRVMSDPSRYPEFDGILDGTELLSLQNPPFVRRRVNYDDF